MSEAFAEEWERYEYKGEVIDVLRRLPISWRQKKAALYEWCMEHDEPLVARDIERVTGRPAGEV